MLSCTNLTMDFIGKALFKDVSLNLVQKNRYAVVGANGSGKSTFLKVLNGDESPSGGTISVPKNAVIGMLRQDHFKYENYRVIDVVIEGKPELFNALREKEKIFQQEEITEKDCYRLAELEETVARLHGYEAEAKAFKILHGLGIEHEKITGPLTALSGGYKLRVLLAQALFQDPDILLLDEPTNHLDIVSISWLERFLCQEYKGLLIFISHDREFINRTITHILDVDYQTITCYRGNYDAFLRLKEENLAQKQNELTHKQQRIDEMQEYADKFRAKPGRSKQALSRLRMIDKIELPEIKDSSRVRLAFQFLQTKPSGKNILEVKSLSQAFGEHLLFDNLNFHINRGQKLAIIGPNGVGKSTLLKTLLNEVEPFTGLYRWGETVKIGYFAQNFHELLDPDQTIMQWCQHQANKVSEIDIRKILGQMLFSGDDIYKPIRVLSGGECARLIFARLMLSKPNVLVLDEPTNHLDLESIEGLVEGCKQFPGTLLFVSHNRYFLNNVANQLLVMLPKRTQIYPGSYAEYIETMGEDYLQTACGNA